MVSWYGLNEDSLLDVMKWCSNNVLMVCSYVARICVCMFLPCFALRVAFNMCVWCVYIYAYVLVRVMRLFEFGFAGAYNYGVIPTFKCACIE